MLLVLSTGLMGVVMGVITRMMLMRRRRRAEQEAKMRGAFEAAAGRVETPEAHAAVARKIALLAEYRVAAGGQQLPGWAAKAAAAPPSRGGRFGDARYWGW